jgi:predicted DNA-binding transcriptional regulator AlpA
MQQALPAPVRQSQRRLDDRLVNARELTVYLGIGLRTLYRLVRMGKLPPPIKLGTKAVRWRFSTIEALLDKLQSSAKAAARVRQPAAPSEEQIHCDERQDDQGGVALGVERSPLVVA